MLKVLSGFLLFATSGSLNAAIILSGDANIGSPLNGTGGASSINLDNQTWFSNILGSGTSVAIQDDFFTGSVEFSTNAINNYYNGLGGVSSSIYNTSNTITDASLANVDLFISILPNANYAASEVSAMQNFLDDGGTLFLMGDNSNSSAQNARINSLLSGLGSGMLLNNAFLDGGFNTTTNIDTDLFNAGVSSFTYAYTSEVNIVSGGTSLIRTAGNGTTFIAYENTAPTVPEPATMVLLSSGLVGLAIFRRKVKKA